MAGLQRSSETFRRSGSSGLVWEDMNLAGQMNTNTSKAKEQNAADSTAGGGLRQSQSVGGVGMMRRNRSTGGGGAAIPAVKAFRSDQVAPAMDPPSPKVSCCGFCGDLRKTESGQKGKPRRR
ncbi:hypothetical protein KSP39_PZI005574 [Platanthera zijinensis]|uniref:MAPK kinase substrate protein n=1 Tax=Platanthera zijinensis TaxID=2320716 RepID=A0AAP0BTP4_9ASPA